MMVGMAAAAPPPVRFGGAEQESTTDGRSRPWVVPASAGVLVLVVLLASASWFRGESTDVVEPVPLLVAEGVRDDFLRTEPVEPLGDARTGQAWEEVSGTWEAHDGLARVVEANDLGARTVAVVDLGSSDGAVAVTAAAMVEGFGLVWRYEDAFNYWFLAASPRFGSWRLQRLDDGTTVDLGGIGLAPAIDGTTVEVRFEDRTTTVFVDGVEQRELVDDALVDATSVGVLVEGPDVLDAAWDDFVAVPSPGPSATSVDPS